MQIRTGNLARPEEVYQLAGKLLDKFGSRLKESDLWNAREDYAIACIQLGKRDEALSIVNKVAAEFPASCRALRLKGMYLESIGKQQEASMTYEAGLQKIDPQSIMMIHRKIALKKGQGDVEGALDLLHKHLDVQLGDWQAWYEAGKLHAKRGAYAEATFCLEEVLMYQPADIATQLLLADCLYASGTQEQIQIAKKYYASVVELTNGSNIKSLFGICLCTARLNHMKCKENNEELSNLAAETLLREYALKAPDVVTSVKQVIDSLSTSRNSK